MRSPADAGAPRPFVLELRDVTPGDGITMDSHPADTPARIGWEGDRVTVTHREFLAELDPFTRRGVLCRRMSASAALEISLKVALCSTLPLEGGVPLHAAAVVLDASAGIFFGPSGAGKSTLAASADTPVLSDELIAVRREGGAFGVRATGFWGTLNREDAPLEHFPVAGLFELKQEPALRIEAMPADAMLRRLLGVTIVPPAPPLWSHVVAVLAALAEAVPGYELGWSKDSPPWAAVRRACRIP